MTHAPRSDRLTRYRDKRDFSITPEPMAVAGRPKSTRSKPLRYVIQKHWASRLHYDLRLELDGVLLSWAVPKGPSFDPAAKQLAIHVEDHPLSYADFEGTIPSNQYGAGTVIVWDRGTWEPQGDPHEGLRKGKLIFALHGEKLAGVWELVRISKDGDEQDRWLLLKKRGDAWARPTSEYDVVTALPDSVVRKPHGPVERTRNPAFPTVRPANLKEAAAALPGANEAELPENLSPQLATLSTGIPAQGAWTTEPKLDGYRLLARIKGKQVRMFTRNGIDWTAKLKHLVAPLARRFTGASWLDGEIVVLDERGMPRFNRLQNAIDNARTAQVVYFIFDLPFFAGQDLRNVALADRRTLLKRLFTEPGDAQVRFSDSLDVEPADALQAACRVGLEGVIIKRSDAPYASGRTNTWLKLKCQLRQEFVVIGFTDRVGASDEVGSLLIGYDEAGKLRPAGSVGTGWNAATGRDLLNTLSRLEVRTPSVDPATIKPGRWSRRPVGSEHWVRPRMVVEVSFSEWTPDGRVRHAVFRGVRTDKPPSQVVREQAPPPTEQQSMSPTSPARTATSITISHADRVIDPSTGLKKVDLVRYYESVADWMMPHLRGRPVALVRAPQGLGGQQFFQKHADAKLAGLAALDPDLWPGHKPWLSVNDPQALIAAAQMNVIEFHTWNSTVGHIDRPDRVVFDLDPGEGVSWAHVKQAATLLRTFLTDLGLTSWLKTSGGKGLHVVAPVSARRDHRVVKGFSRAVAAHMAHTIPSRFVAKAGAGNRIGKIFIDYLRNGEGQTTVAAFSARARPGLGVSMPLGWDQLGELKGAAQWTIATARDHLSFQREDPWADYWKTRQTLTHAMKALGYRPGDEGVS